MDVETLLKELIELGKKNNDTVVITEITKYFAEDSEEFSQIEEGLKNAEIDVVSKDDNTSVEQVEDEFNPDDTEVIDVSDFDK